MLKRNYQRGVTLIELGIGLAILGVLLALALPSFRTFMQNTQIKNAAESTLAGLSLARAEAVRRNSTVRFQFVSNLTNGCALSATALNWVVSRGDPTGLCLTAPAALDDDTVPTGADPKIIQKHSAQEGSRDITVATTGGAAVTFNALGRVVGAGITQIDFTNPTGGVCADAGGDMRCLRIMVTNGGQIKMCDPKVAAASDPRRCV